MTTPENQPPPWQTPDYPAQKPPYQGGATPGGYPPPSYPSPQPQSYPPGQPQAYPPHQPGYPPQPYPPAQPQAYPPPQPGYPSPQPQSYPPAQPGYPSQPQGYPPSPPGSYQGGTYQGGTYQAGTYPGGTYQGGAPPGSYPPVPPPAGLRLPDQPGPPKKSGAAKILGSLGGVLGIIVVVVILVVIRNAGNIFDGGGGGGGGPTITDPFEGTVAADYSNGEAGIVLPAATAVAGFTEQEVATALETVKGALIAGRLDETMFYDHDRTALLALFSPAGAEELNLWFDEKLGGIFATMIAPGHELRDDPVKVKGTITFAGAIIDGITMLEVNAKFVWVYPFTGELAEAGDHLVTLNDDLYLIFPVPSEVEPDFVGMFPDSRSTSFAYNIDCALLEQDLVALGTPQYTIGGGDDVNQDDVMDPNNPADFEDTC